MPPCIVLIWALSLDGDARIDHIARIVEITFISYRSTVLAGSVFNPVVNGPE